MSPSSRVPAGWKLSVIIGAGLAIALIGAGAVFLTSGRTMVGAAALLALGVAGACARLARPAIPGPILELLRKAGRIADRNGFSVRPSDRRREEAGALATAFDQMLDERRGLDEELRDAQHELERKAEQADRAQRLQDEFLAMLSHELRTPLNAILGWAQILRRGGLDPAAADRALEAISRNALAQGRIIADLLDLQGIKGGTLRLTLRSLDLASEGRRAIEAVSPAARLKEIEILDLMDDVGPILGDAGRLQQVLSSLLSNAVKFTPRGGQVRVELGRAGAQAELKIKDTGPGIKPGFLPSAFDPFRQADSSSERRHGGLGLGLALVRPLVELHGGTVTAANRGSGAGAVFTVKLPLLGERTALEGAASSARLGRYPEIQAESLARVPSLHGIRVLVVDDEPDARAIAETTLSRCGADVTSAASAEEGFAALKQGRPHVLLSDLEMPHEDGYSLVQRIRALPADQGGATPAAAFTALTGPRDRGRALCGGFQIYVPKPVQPAELVAVVSTLARGLAPRPQDPRFTG